MYYVLIKQERMKEAKQFVKHHFPKARAVNTLNPSGKVVVRIMDTGSGYFAEAQTAPEAWELASMRLLNAGYSDLSADKKGEG